MRFGFLSVVRRIEMRRALAIFSLSILPTLAAAAPKKATILTPVIDPQTRAYLAAGQAAGSTNISQTGLLALNRFIRRLKTANVCASEDFFYLFAVNTAAQAAINLCNPGVLTATPTNSPGFLAYRGIQSNGTTSYYDTGFNPTTAVSPKFTQNSASMGVFSLSSGVKTTFEMGNTRSSIRILSNSSLASAIPNMSSTTNITTASDGQQSASWSRTASNAWQFYSNGAPLGAAQTGVSTSMTNSNFWCGGSNLTVPVYSTRRLAYCHSGAALSAIQIQTIYNATIQYLAAVGVAPFPWPGDALYVSNTNVNGIPIGNDSTGDGSAAAPYLTFDKAITAANDGEVVLLNDGTYSPASTFYSITKGLNVHSVTPYGATWLGIAGQSSVARSSCTTGCSITLGDINITPGDAVTTACIVLTAETTTYTLTMNGTICSGVQYMVNGSGTTKANVNFNSAQFIGGATARSMLNIGAHGAGAVSFVNPVVTFTDSTTAGFGALATAYATTSAPTFTSSGAVVNVTAAPASLVSYFGGVLLNNGYAGYSISGGSMNITAKIGNAFTQCKMIVATYDITSAGANIVDASNGTIHDIGLSANCPLGGANILIGMDGDPLTLREHANNPNIYNVTITNSADFGGAVGIGHCIELGYQSGGTVTRNSADYCQFGIVSKGMSGTPLYYSNLFTHVNAKVLFQKAGDGSQFWNNVDYEDGSASCIDGGGLLIVCRPALIWDEADATGTPGTGGVWGNNIGYRQGGGSYTWLEMDPSCLTCSIAGLHNNNYYASDAVATSWVYGLTTYPSLVTWQAVEPTALGVNPSFVSAPSNLQLNANSALIAAGLYNAATPTDFVSILFANPPSVGAYQWR